MKIKTITLFILVLFPTIALSEGITEFDIAFRNRLPVRNIDGTITIDMSAKNSLNVNVSKDFYGADNKGFSGLPATDTVLPLELSKVKFGGNLHSTHNWQLNSYFDIYENIFGVTQIPLDQRLRSVKDRYNTEPLVQVNMMGWQPERQSDNTLAYTRTADASHAGKMITFLNGEKKLGIKNILMGNEPFLWESTHGKYSPSADEYIEMFIDYVVAIKDAQNEINGRPNDLKIWGPEMATGWTGWQTNHPSDCTVNYALTNPVSCRYGADGEFSDFVPYFLSKIQEFEIDKTSNPYNYKMLDFLTIHYYPLFRDEFSDPNSIIKNVEGQNVAGMLESVNLWDSPTYINRFDKASPLGVAPSILPKLQAWKNDYYPSASLAVTEFGIDSVENVNYNPIVRPLYLADLVPRLAQFGTKTFIHSFLQGGANESSWALINGNSKTHLYYMYSLYTQKFKGEVLRSEKTYGDEVNSYSVNNGTTVNLFLVNKNTKVHNAAIKISRGETSAQEIAEVSLPAWSLTVLEIPLNKDGVIKAYRYGAQEMGL